MIFSLMLALAQDAQTVSPPPACDGKEFQAFDFWVGDWDVRPAAAPDGEPTARSIIKRAAGGCAVLESWQPKQGRWGVSLNALHDDGRWHQRWVGGGGEIVEFVGGPNEDGEMVLEGVWPGAAGPGSEPIVRMTFTRLEDGSVRQHGEQSTDEGETWSDSFDLIYSKPPPTPPPPMIGN